jgi:HAD superfamily hydrolase (TIGR01509 family)
MPQTPEALIFDVDGTLAETEEAHRQAFNSAFLQHGLEWEWDLELYKALLATSGGKERIRAYATQYDPDRLDDDGFDELVGRLHATKTRLYTDMVARGQVPLRPGIQSLIDEARTRGLKLAIATTTTRANVDALLTGATSGAGHHWFDVIACSDDAPVKKPDPQVYQVVLDRLGLPADACLAIEDSNNGVRAAVAARIPVVVTKSIFTESPDYPGAIAVYTNLEGVSLEDIAT